MREKKEKLAFLFGSDDHWGPLQMFEEVCDGCCMFKHVCCLFMCVKGVCYFPERLQRDMCLVCAIFARDKHMF